MTMKAAAPTIARPDRLATWEEVCQAAVANPEQLAELARIHGLAFGEQQAVDESARLTAEDFEFLYHLGEPTEQPVH